MLSFSFEFLLHSIWLGSTISPTDFLQREELRARFPGVPADLVNYFLYVAEELRGVLAQLGYEKLDDIIGHTELLRPRDISLVKTQHLDLSYILSVSIQEDIVLMHCP